MCRQSVVPILLSLLLLCTVAEITGCKGKPSDEKLVEAWTLCENLKYEQAFPIIREYLLHYPDNSVAHYLLGKCYQKREHPALTLAKGELDMARFLFERDRNLSVLGEAMTAEQFQATLHCDTVLILLSTIIEAEEQGMPPEEGTPILRIALEHARKAVELNPESPFIIDLAHTLETMLESAEKAKKYKTPEVFETPEPKPPSPGQWLT